MHITIRDAHESARDYALRILKDNIIHIKLEPGSMVSEKELAAELGLSRGPVREALIELSRIKIVEVYPQRGSIISKVDYDLMEEARFMRETLEIAVAERCCRTGLQPEHLAALEENVKLQQFYRENRNDEKLWSLDNAFHHRLFLNANAVQIYTLMKSMLVHFDRVRAMALTVVKEKEITFVGEHRLILDTIIKGDHEAVGHLMHEHLTHYQVDKKAIQTHYAQYLK